MTHKLARVESALHKKTNVGIAKTERQTNERVKKTKERMLRPLKRVAAC